MQRSEEYEIPIVMYYFFVKYGIIPYYSSTVYVSKFEDYDRVIFLWMVLNFISLNQPSNRFLSNLETIALTLHEKSKSLSNFAWLFFHNHGTILNLQPIGTWRIQFSIQCYGFIHERTVSSNHIQNWNLEILLL